MATIEEHIESIKELGRDLRDDFKNKDWKTMSDDIDGIRESLEILDKLVEDNIEEE